MDDKGQSVATLDMNENKSQKKWKNGGKVR